MENSPSITKPAAKLHSYSEQDLEIAMRRVVVDGWSIYRASKAFHNPQMSLKRSVGKASSKGFGIEIEHFEMKKLGRPFVLPTEMHPAYEKSFTPKEASAGFLKTGTYPLNRAAIAREATILSLLTNRQPSTSGRGSREDSDGDIDTDNDDIEFLSPATVPAYNTSHLLQMPQTSSSRSSSKRIRQTDPLAKCHTRN